MHLVLVRHGEPGWTEDGFNRDEPRLTFRGRQQALLLAAALADEPFDAVWVSPKLRAVETATPYLELTGMEAANLDFLAEIGNPEWEGTDLDALKIFAAHRRRLPDLQWEGLEGGEAVTDFHYRVTTGLDAALSDMGIRRSSEKMPTWNIDEDRLDQRILVFAHARNELGGVDSPTWRGACALGVGAIRHRPRLDNRRKAHRDRRTLCVQHGEVVRDAPSPGSSSHSLTGDSRARTVSMVSASAVDLSDWYLRDPSKSQHHTNRCTL